MERLSNVLVVFYEDLREDALKEIRRVAEFLPSNLVEKGEAFERRLICMNLDLTGKFKRPPRKLDFDPYNADHRNKFELEIRNVSELLRQYHQPDLPKSYFQRK